MQQAICIPLYMDWSFWAVVVAALALILSQLPPLHQVFRRGQLDVEPYSRIHLTHKVGNPNAQLHLILTNIGGSSVRVKGITLKIRRDGKDVALLPAQNYLENPGDKLTVLFTSFSLKPKEDWAHIINFLNYFTRTDDKKYRAAESKLRESILEKKKIPENKDIVVEVDDKTISPFIEMFNEKFIWLTGEYEIQISVCASDKKANVEKRYRFTLFESDSNELSKVKDSYKSGDGINWDSGNHPGVLVQIVEA